MAFEAEDREKVHRGVILTLLGRLAGLSHGVFLFVAKALFGAIPFGLFAIAYALTELLARLVIGGFNDGITYFAARHVASEDEERLYRTIGTCLRWPILTAVVVAGSISALAPWLHAQLWSRHAPELVTVVQIMAWTLPLAVLVHLPVAAVKAHLDMKWAVLVVETALPLVNITLAVVAALADTGPVGLATAWVASHAVCVPLAWYGYSRYFSLGKTARHFFGDSEPEVARFAWPQSVNMAFNYGLTRDDALMLSLWVGAEIIGVYVLVSDLVRAIRNAKTAFVGVFGPLVARYRELDNREGIAEALNSLARIAAAASIPLMVATLAFYSEATTFAPGEPWVMSRWVPWLLAVGPMLSCFFGLSGNLLLMSGHSRLLLLNSSISMAINVALNLALIPLWGPVGAAIATMVSGVCLALLQIVELGRVENIRFQPGNYLKPVIGGLLAAAAIAWINSDTGLGWIYGFGSVPGLGLKVLATLAVVISYIGLVVAWPGRNPERAWLAERLAAVRG